MLRDAADDIEVFMVKRHGSSDVLGGVYVFPGGKMDGADADPDILQRLGAPLAALHSALGEAEIDALTAAGLFVAACRETFEEAGILLAADASARHVAEAQRRARAGVAFGAIVAQLGLALNWNSVIPWTRWITPPIPSDMKKRFDTRFFLAVAPNDQEARHDDHEATGSFWLRPRVVLERYWEDRITLAPPQIMSLVALARHTRVADVVAAARGLKPPIIQPEPFMYEQRRAVAFPGNASHPVSKRAIVGPSFLVYRNKRYEPGEGFDAFFA